LSRFMSPSDTGFLMYATRTNMLDTLKGFGSSQYKHVDMHRIHRCETLRVCYSAPNAKLCLIFIVKMRHHVAVFSQRKLGKNSILCAMMHLRRSAARFSP